MRETRKNRMRELKFRAWDADWHRFEYFEIGENGDRYGIFRVAANKFGTTVEQYTGLKDKNGDKEIYEYDIIDGEGNIIGNYHETPELLKDKTNLLIQGFGTKTWLTTYQEAVERGCHDA